MISHRYAGVALAALLAAAPAAAQEAPIAVQEAPVAIEPADPMPAPPDGITAAYAPPPRDAQGAYLTPNRDLSPEETSWHVRAALNVAALGCRGADGDAMVASYNAMLAADRVPLAHALEAVEAGMRKRFGAAWQAESDGAMTRLYNFFASPPAQAAFCAAARDVLRETATLEPDAFAAFATDALPRLEAPFLATFAACDDWRARVAAWTARHAPAPAPVIDRPSPVLIATAATVSPAMPVTLHVGPEGP